MRALSQKTKNETKLSDNTKSSYFQIVLQNKCFTLYVCVHICAGLLCAAVCVQAYVYACVCLLLCVHMLMYMQGVWVSVWRGPRPASGAWYHVLASFG